MPEETYSDFKEEQTITPAQRPHVQVIRTKEGNTIVVRRRARLRDQQQLDYSSFKATVETTVASAVREIKAEIQIQHQQTRAEVQSTRKDVLAAIKASPAAYLKLMSEFGSLSMLFSLAIWLSLKIELVNPAFAMFMLLAFAVYWCMAQLKESADTRRNQDA